MKMGSVIVENGKKMLTMTEYIEREAAIRFLLNDSPEQVNYSREDVADCIRYMNAADVVKVVHGKWGDNGIAGSMLVKCSVCGFDCGANSFSYCPNCCAKMDGGDNNSDMA